MESSSSSAGQAASQSVLDQIVASLQIDAAPAIAQQLEVFARHYTRRVPSQTLAEGNADKWAGVLRSHFELARKRLPEQSLVRVFNPSPDQGGWNSSRTIVQIIHADMPFLVDSVTMAIAEQGSEIHLIVHPIFRVQRDAGSYLMDLAPLDAQLDGADNESVMLFEVDRISEPQQLAELRQHIERNLHDVSLAVRDWTSLKDRFGQTCDSLEHATTPYSPEAVEETVEFLRWLAADHFTMLGYREYRFVETDGQSMLHAVEDSGLGILADPNGGAVSTVSPARLLDPLQINDAGPLVITKTNARATVHRAGYMDYVGVMLFDGSGKLVGEQRFLGLYTSSAYNRRPWNIPYIRQKVDGILAASGFAANSHGGKALLHIMATLPRDELFQASRDELAEIVMGIYALQERRQTRLFVRPDQFGRFYSCLVFIPRDRFNTENRERVQRILRDTLGGDQLDFTVQVDESVLARLHVIVRVAPNSELTIDPASIEQELVTAVRSWHDRLKDVLIEKFGEEKGLLWARTYGRAFPAAYVEDVSPWVAAFDVENLARLVSEDDIRLSLYRPRSGKPGVFRFKIFRTSKTLPLSDVLPMLENMGLRIFSERPYQLRMDDGSNRWVQDFDMHLADEGDLELELIRDNFQQAFERVVRGDAESDGFNRLVLRAELSWRQVAFLRTYCKYLLQTGLPFSQAYMERTLAAHPGIARLAVMAFEARFDPNYSTDEAEATLLRERLGRLFSVEHRGHLIESFETIFESRQQKDRASACDAALRQAIEQVSSLDEDRILRAFADAIRATLRTNAYQTANGALRSYISIKLDSSKVDELPKPRPWREIFVYSPRIEGIHLRGGAVARGGLRWSDRPEDFRTEVLGLMKAQMVKNTIIVPVGAKGGFVVKRMPQSADRDVVMAEVVACYRFFINGLLDITDNLREGEVVHPEQVLRLDPDDPYLVVAADKGTATFSDIANSVSQAHDFWMGDAFASGGSVGYDHKGMGITAKGGWESVKRHFRELGVNCQEEAFTAVGIGDMAGDVFGNGMLLSPCTRLLAAFNHLHIFLDPNPNAAASCKERQRLFELPRSSWTDYQADLISAGGGVFSRADKSIPISSEVKQALGIKADVLPPNELIRAILKAPVDLLWNGGIGTYVKSSQESHAEVGDRANDVLRITGRELRCKVVGEGGNLGLTQLGRVEFALNGGKVNTDFVDNSAGVDCSDHEVNIKILLNDVQRAGLLSEAARNALLAQMTDEVEQLVLRNNYLQSQALTMMESWAVSRLGSKIHLMEVLEKRGALDRDLEFLPGYDEIAERRKRGIGFTRPELCVLLAYSKITLYEDLIATDIADDPYLSEELVRYFPGPLAKFDEQMKNHRLRREIIVTAITNSMVNRMGSSFCLRMQEDTGAEPAQIAKAYTAAREIFAARRWWAQIEQADNQLAAEAQTDLHLMVWTLLRHSTRWLLQNHRDELNIAALVERYGRDAKKLLGSVPELAQVSHGRRFNALKRQFERQKLDKKLATELISMPALKSTLDILRVSGAASAPAKDVAALYFQLDKMLKISWLLAEVDKLPVEGQWHAHARGGLRDELYRQHRLLVERLVESGTFELKPWQKSNNPLLRQHDRMLTDMKNSGGIDYATASVATRALEQLVQAVECGAT